MGNKVKFQPPKHLTQSELSELRHTDNIAKEVDAYSAQCKELQQINSLKDSDNSSLEEHFVYFPWNKNLLKTVGPEELFKLRTNRNRELISIQEQKVLAGKVVGIAGMSVGSSIAMGLVFSGISREIKLADFDVLDTSNLNRLRESLLSVGLSKAHIAAEHLYELDPFMNVHLFDDGLTSGNIARFFTSPKTDLVVDEIDDFNQKLQLRLHAATNKIPLLMFTSLGDNILIDVERYDIDEEQKIFNGVLPHKLEEKLLSQGKITAEEEKALAVQLVGAKYVPTKALKSVQKIGTELVGRPQLYSTVAVDGGLAAYLIRQILLGKPVEAGRYFIKFNELFNFDDLEFDNSPERQSILKSLMGK